LEEEDRALLHYAYMLALPQRGEHSDASVKAQHRTLQRKQAASRSKPSLTSTLILLTQYSCVRQIRHASTAFSSRRAAPPRAARRGHAPRRRTTPRPARRTSRRCRPGRRPGCGPARRTRAGRAAAHGRLQSTRWTTTRAAVAKASAAHAWRTPAAAAATPTACRRRAPRARPTPHRAGSKRALVPAMTRPSAEHPAPAMPAKALRKHPTLQTHVRGMGSC